MTRPELTRAPLIGRDRQLAEIAAALERAAAGEPRVVLVTGEAGAGKTRLLEVARAVLSRGEWLVAEGYALPGQGVPPYYAVGRALRRLTGLVAARPGLAELRPALAAAGLAEPLTGTPDSLAEGRLRLLEAMARVVDLAAAGRPVLLVLDDMQWAGQGDWDAITYIARAVDAPLAILMAAREEHRWEPGSPAANALVELNRQRLLVEVRADALDDEAVASLCEHLLGGRVDGEVAGMVARRSDGNPFFVEEIVRHLVREGALERRGDRWALVGGTPGASSVPPSVQLAAATDLAALLPATRTLLHLAAVAGRTFSSALLVSDEAAATSVDERLGEAARLGIVRRLDSGRWSFRHDLVRDAVLADIEAAALPSLHRAVATALAAAPGAAGDLERLAALAHHWAQARDVPAAARAALDASAAAAGAFAAEEALQLAELAVSAARQLPGEGVEGSGLLNRALLRLGDARTDVGRYVEAEETFAELLARADLAGDAALRGQAWLRLGMVARRREQPDRAAHAFDCALAALEAVPGQASSIGRALVEAASVAGLTTAEYGSAEEYANRAIGIAQSIGDRALEAEALVALANSRTRSEGPRAARLLLEEALIQAEASGHLSLACDTAAGLSNNHYWSGELRRAVDFGQKRLELATKAHDIFGLRHGHSWLALLAASRGEWSTALGMLAEAEPMLSHLASPEPVGFIRVVSAFIHYRMGDNDRACQEIGDALDRLDPLGPGTLLWYGSLAALLYATAGRHDEARDQMERQEERLRQVPAASLPARSARTALGLAYAQTGDSDGATRCAEALEAYADDYHWSPARRTLAAAAALRGQPEQALALLRQARRQVLDEGARPDLGLILLDEARLLPSGDPSQRETLEKARRVFVELGMKREAAVAEGWLSGHARAALPGGLTAREVEVLRLLAEGMTNRRIADALVLSERTVVNHVTHIYGKIGVENRAGATAFAARSGLLSPQ